MYIVVGLGNPGRRYARTRHNMGFLAVDKLAEDKSIRIGSKKFQALVGEGTVNGERLLLVKPQTYMNLSGSSVQQISEYYRLPHENLIVIYDDIDIPLGTVRVRKSGGPGTHNGMKSVISCLGFSDFPRVRLGIGGGDERTDLIHHVVGKVSKAERKLLEDLASSGAAAVCDIIASGIDAAMNTHNSSRRDARE